MEEIYFAGGEPLLTDKHFEMLDFLISNVIMNKRFLKLNQLSLLIN